MKILMLNQDWFAESWRAQGHEVVVAGTGNHCQIQFPFPLVPWTHICELVPGGFSPDCIVVHDNSSPIMVSGLEVASIPLVFYSVDTHHHHSLHRLIAGVFDHTFVAQKDYIPFFEEIGETPTWLPLWASREVEASDDKKYGAVFVGTMDRNLNPDRVNFFEALKTKTDVVIERGEYWKIFPFAEIVINQTVKGDLNFRVFEAMMCGAALLTEKSGNGLTDLFTPDKHLLTYNKGDVDQAAGIISGMLADKSKLHAIAEAGRAEIVAKHLPKHRATTVMEVLKTLTRRTSKRRYYGMAANYSAVGVQLFKYDQALAMRSEALALGCAERGAQAGEAMTHDLACHLVLAALQFDKLQVGSRQGLILLQKLSAQYPTEQILALAVIRDHLNHGEADAAKVVVQRSGFVDSPETYKAAERVIGELLSKASR